MKLMLGSVGKTGLPQHKGEKYVMSQSCYNSLELHISSNDV